jgi:hexulose-6-phosphate isomerase
MKKGICQSSFPKGMPIEQVLDHCRLAGFDALELIMSIHPKDSGLTLESTAAEVAVIGEIARSKGVELRTLQCGAASQYLGLPDREAQSYGRNIILKQLEIAHWLGMNTILTVPARITPHGPTYEECWNHSTEQLHHVLPQAEAYRIAIGIENVKFSRFLMSDLEMIRYIDQFASPYLGAYCDIGNVLYNGIPERWIRSLNSRIRKIHFKDLKVSANYASVPLLYGDVNWPEVMQAIRDIGYDDLLTAEIPPSLSYPLQAVYDTSRHMDTIIQGKAG